MFGIEDSAPNKLPGCPGILFHRFGLAVLKVLVRRVPDCRCCKSQKQMPGQLTGIKSLMKVGFREKAVRLIVAIREVDAGKSFEDM